MHIEQCLSCRLIDQSSALREHVLNHTLHPPLLRDIRRDADKHWQHRALSCPFTRGDARARRR